ncbi:MAG: major facilitator superfamily domain-containing protein 6 [Chloroflexota bacterium]
MKTAKSFYFIYFAAAACLIPFLTLYYREIGLSGREIGFLTGLVPLITLAGTSVWSALADATRRYRFILSVAIVSTWLSVFLLLQANSFVLLIPIVAAYAFFVAPIIPLVDNTVMNLLGPRKNEYGRQRVWGAYGWGLAAAIVGLIIQQTGLSWAFYTYLTLLLVLLGVATRLPIQQSQINGKFWIGLRLLLTNRRWLLFLGVVLIEGMCLSIFLNYLFLYLDELGTNRVIMGLTLTVATLSEIPIFLNSRKLLKWGAPFLLAFSLIFMVIRSFAYANVTAPWQVLVISLLHGPTFAAMWAAGVAYAAEIAPPGLGATAQGVLNGTVFGLGTALGAFTGGYLYDTAGVVAAFRWAGWASLAALLVFLWAHRRSFAHQLKMSLKTTH